MSWSPDWHWQTEPHTNGPKNGPVVGELTHNQPFNQFINNWWASCLIDRRTDPTNDRPTDSLVIDQLTYKLDIDRYTGQLFDQFIDCWVAPDWPISDQPPKRLLIGKVTHLLNFNFSFLREPLFIHVFMGCTVRGCLQLLQMVWFWYRTLHVWVI